MNKSELVELVKANSEKSKNEVAAMLMENGAAFSAIPKIIKESGIKFGRSGGITLKQRVIEIVVNDPEISYEDIEFQLSDYTKDAKFVAKNVGSIVKETLRLMAD